MALSGILFILWRLAELITLIPIFGMLAYFVHGFTSHNILTPNYILVLFIVSVLAAAWALATLVGYARARHSGGFVAFVDLCFVGALIAGVYELRGIAGADCGNFAGSSTYLNLGVVGVYGPELHVDKSCAMLKACFALGIMNCVFFFFTFLLALLVHRHHKKDDRVVVKRETHYSRSGSRRSGSRDYYQGSPRRSHHSHRSSRRQYYV